jgi:hypothetical protein
VRQPSARSGIAKSGARPLTNQAGHVELSQANRDGKAGASPGKLKVDEREVRLVVGCCGDRAFRIVRDCDDPVTRIVLDQILHRRCEMRIVLDDQNLEH